MFGENAGGGNGVFGQTNSSGLGAAVQAGVWGDNLGGGSGVYGTSATGNGVVGVAPIGVAGSSNGAPNSIGVAAYSPSAKTIALQVVGKATFSRSGIVSIATGKTSATVTGVSMTASSLVLAVVQNNAGVSVAYAVPSVTKSTLTINLNKAVASGKSAKVAWFVVN